MSRFSCTLLLACLAHWAFADQLLRDPGFRLGVSVAAVAAEQIGDMKRPRIEGHVQVADTTSSPIWMLAQWGSRSSLLGEYSATCREGRVCRHVLQEGRESKAVVLDDGDFDIRLRSDGLAEFTSRYDDGRLYLQPGETWPHLLVSQPVRSRAIADYDSMVLRFDARLDENSPHVQDGYDARIHAARFVIALNLKNRFTHDFIWVMLPVYDDRWPMSQHGCQKCSAGPDDEPVCLAPESMNTPGQWRCPHDAVRTGTGEVLGTSRMLFRLPSASFVDRPLQPGIWVPHEIDLKPWLLEALKAATGQGERGFLYQPADFRLASISLGWEISALNRVSLSLKGLSLEATR
ncbi:MAG: hypothetical protein EP312_03325 [Gammaproteobacteria bacterium]|nr:MAG: hypothetical protein EP312_03325 [Gammaproteobacteria bacterium]